MSDTVLNPYLFFTGNAREAMGYYKTIFGGELSIMTVGEVMGPDAPSPEHVMHAKLSGGALTLLASDGDRTTPYETSRITLCLSGKNGEELTTMFNALADGGEVSHPLTVESWGDAFGTLTDKYGIDWMVNIDA